MIRDAATSCGRVRQKYATAIPKPIPIGASHACQRIQAVRSRPARCQIGSGCPAASRAPQIGNASSAKTRRIPPRASVGRPSSFSADASRTNTRAGRISPSGAFDDIRAPSHTAGRAPRRIVVVSPSWKSPTRMWASAAAETSGMACTRSVPTSSAPRRLGYSNIRQTMMIEPDPTEVRPTKNPPSTPTKTVGIGRTRIGAAGPRGSAPARRAAALRRPCR